MRTMPGLVALSLLIAVTGCGRSGGPAGPSPDGPSPAAGGGSTLCTAPGDEWEKRAPEQLGLDAAKLQAALDWSNVHRGLTTAVYRHGCLAQESQLDAAGFRDQALDGWSATKAVTSMVVGRAMSLGLYDLDMPIGAHVHEADAAHARLTPRHFLTMTSGLYSNYVRDFALPLPDRVCDALALPPEHEPGTHWQYAQSTLDLMIWDLERAIGRDFQEFAQAELFGPIGIAEGTYTWDRDPHGHTNAWAHLKMRGRDWAKLGQLMLQAGMWNGRRLLSESYVQQALSRNPLNPAYGMLFWINGGAWWQVPDVEGHDEGQGSLIKAGPDDMFMMVGLGEQRIYIIPSYDMVIVRVGERGSNDTDTRVTVWSGRGGEVDHELVRLVMLSVTDRPYADPGPYESAGVHVPPTDSGILGDALIAADLADGMSTPACH